MSAENILQTVVGKVGEFYEWLADRLNDDAARAEVLIDLGLPPNIPVGQPFPQHKIKGINVYRKTISVETEVSTAHAQDLGKVLGLSSSKAAKLVLPEKNQEDASQPKVNEKNVLNIVLGADNKIYWYIGFTQAQVQETNYTDAGLRKVLQEQSKLNEKLVILVKPQDESTYENLVDTLDELTINSIARYALVEYAADDKALIDAFTGGGAAPAQVGG